MEEQEKLITQYLVPANVSAKFEFFSGFGWCELKIVILACIVGFMFFYGLGFLKKSVYIEIVTDEVNVGNITYNNEIPSDKEGYRKLKVDLIPPAFRLLFILIPGAGAFFLVKRDPISGMSLISMTKGAAAFKKKQKLFLYKYNSY